MYNVSMNNNKENDSELVENTIKELCHFMAKSMDEDFIFDFITCLFTNAELTDIAKRWLLVKEIDKGTTQREIAKKYGMSLCKITRGAKELSKKDSAFRNMLKMMEAENE